MIINIDGDDLGSLEQLKGYFNPDPDPDSGVYADLLDYGQHGDLSGWLREHGEVGMASGIDAIPAGLSDSNYYAALKQAVTGEVVVDPSFLKPPFNECFHFEGVDCDVDGTEAKVKVKLKVLMSVNEDYRIEVRSGWGTRPQPVNPSQYAEDETIVIEFVLHKRHGQELGNIVVMADGNELAKNEYSSDIFSTFLSFGGFTLGKSNIYDVEAPEYVKENDSVFGDYKIIRAENEDSVDFIASAKDKIVFAFIIKDISSFDMPKSWERMKINKVNLSLSMEKVLGKNGFEWEDLENSGTSRGFAFKKANEGKYLTFVIDGDDSLTIALLDDEQKSSLCANLQEVNGIDGEEMPCCPNGCGHVWGNDDECSDYKPDTLEFTAGGVSFKMIRVEGGTFTMGATSEQGSDAYDDEKPAHRVTLSSYYIGETQVTQVLWRAVMGSNPSHFKGDDLPVEMVSWDGDGQDSCKEFVRKLNRLTGKNFRLPTEAEWEYAARGGNKSRGYKYSGSNNPDDVAWYDGNSGGKTHPVKAKKPNELGIYDMSGNVWEWCQDCYGGYSATPQTNPQGPDSGSFRVYRGGCWYFYARYCRVSNRYYNSPSNRNDHLGLRLVFVE